MIKSPMHERSRGRLWLYKVCSDVDWLQDVLSRYVLSGRRRSLWLNSHRHELMLNSSKPTLNNTQPQSSQEHGEDVIDNYMNFCNGFLIADLFL